MLNTPTTALPKPLSPENDLDRSAGAHDRHMPTGPGQVDVALQVLQFSSRAGRSWACGGTSGGVCGSKRSTLLSAKCALIDLRAVITLLDITSYAPP